MLPPNPTDEPLTFNEMREATELLSCVNSCMGQTHESIIVLLKQLLMRRDASSRVVFNTLRENLSCHVQEAG